jgi:putative tryptophan/tyrosine transport system substrate-binding protein
VIAGGHMQRRVFISGLGVAALWPFATRAQQPTRVPTIGFLGSTSPEIASHWMAAFLKRLRELGWIEGRTIAIEYRWADSHSERYSEIAAEFVGLKVDVIVTWASAPVLAAKQATTLIPIVFAAQMDPVGAGVVASLARPGGNVTGMSTQQTDTAGKRIELLREVVPKLARLAIMANVGAPGAVLEMREVLTTARSVGLEVTPIEVRQAAEIVSAIEALKGRADSLYVATDPLIFSNRIQINALAQAARLPTIYGSREYVDAGGLMSYGPNWSDLFRHAAEVVNKILRGTKPADIPVEQPTKFDLILNLKTAKALGLELPSTLLARADEVIE